MSEIYLFIMSHPLLCLGILITLLILVICFVEDYLTSILILCAIMMISALSIGFGYVDTVAKSANTCRQILINPLEKTKETIVFYGTDVYSRNGAISFKDSNGTLHSLDMASFKDSTFTIEDVEQSYCE